MSIVDNNQFINKINKPYNTPIPINNIVVIAGASDVIIPNTSTPPYNRYYLNPTGYTGEKSITITASDGTVSEVPLSGGAFTPMTSGIYIIRYKGAVRHVEGGTGAVRDSPFTIAFYITAVANQDPLPKWNIASVIDRVLNLCEPHLTTVAPRFHLDPAQREQFSKIESPEFAFTKKTLKEILDAIGGFIHGIPRLIKGESGKFDTIHFDMLGGTEQALLADEKYEKTYVTQILTHDIESYATELDSSTDNIVNVLDGSGGTITEPYMGGARTVRTEDLYVQVLESNMEIATDFPIYTVNKVEVMLENNKVGDITAYVFEKSDYIRLSSYDGAYPTSKAFALYYELGQKGIRGLNYKSPTVYGGATANYAITNIIRATTDENFNNDWWKDAKYARLRFRITYTPIFSARVLQHKPHFDVNAVPRALSYAQSDNLIESRYYGENLKGVIARMGNPEIIRTYKLANTPNGRKLIPKAGQMWGDDYYVSAVSCAEYADHIDCTLGLSKDFNRLSPYIGINSQWRAYEISEKSAHNRDIVYRDFAAFGATEDDIKNVEVTSCADPDMVLKAIVMTFTQQPDSEITGITSAVVSGFVKGTAQPQSTVTLPVISTAFGNSLVFNFYMADNYSAGAHIEYQNTGSVKGYWQVGTQYPDYYGRLDSVQFSLNGGIRNNPDNSITTAFELPKNAHGNSYPYFLPSYTNKAGARLAVDKNGGETLRFNYELAFVTMNEWKSLIIGPALTHNCPLVNPMPQDEDGAAERKKHAAALYVMPNQIGKFDSTIDTSQATLIQKYDEPDRFGDEPIAAVILGGADYYNSHVQITPEISTAAGKAWVIADQATGEILLARNIDIARGDYISFPRLRLAHFTHKLP